MTDPLEPFAVSLNGVDNVGKTTHVRWLARSVPGAMSVGAIDNWDPRWREVTGSGFADWWFRSCPTPEHVGLVARSHAARRRASGLLALEDRGLPMLRAACAATASIKDSLAPRDALAAVEDVFAAHPEAPWRAEFHLLLRRDIDPGREADLSLSRQSEPPDNRYRSYQAALAQIVSMQAARGEYDAVLTIGSRSLLDVQREVRAALAEFGVAAETLPPAPALVWVLAGMSESGKSTTGELLRDEHGVTRLKIGYLLEVAAARAGVAEPYRVWSEQEQAEYLVEELLRFAETTKARTVSLESARRFEATAHLKRLLGDRCRVVFVDAPLHVRLKRAVEPEASLRERDAVKSSRGAARIIDIADLIVDNSGPLSALKLTTAAIVSTTDSQTLPRSWQPVTNREWLLEATGHLVDREVALVLATGSTGTAEWRRAWSDLDLLVVRDQLSVEWIRKRVNSLRAPSGVKLGVSAFTTSDIAARRVPPRLVQSLQRAGTGEGVLYWRSGFTMPIPSRAEGDRRSRNDLGIVLMTTRRLVATAEIDTRAVYKHLVLLMKVLLRADGRHAVSADEVVTAFRELHPDASVDPPSLDEVSREPGSAVVRQRLLDAIEPLLDHCDQLGDIARPNSTPRRTS